MRWRTQQEQQVKSNLMVKHQRIETSIRLYIRMLNINNKNKYTGQKTMSRNMVTQIETGSSPFL